MWQQIQTDLQQQGRTFADESTTEEEAAPNISALPSAACALAWFLRRSGSATIYRFTDDEVTRAVVERARQFPGQEQQVWEYYRRNAQAMASLRAPLFEERSSTSFWSSPR